MRTPSGSRDASRRGEKPLGCGSLFVFCSGELVARDGRVRRGAGTRVGRSRVDGTTGRVDARGGVLGRTRGRARAFLVARTGDGDERYPWGALISIADLAVQSCPTGGKYLLGVHNRRRGASRPRPSESARARPRNPRAYRPGTRDRPDVARDGVRDARRARRADAFEMADGSDEDRTARLDRRASRGRPRRLVAPSRARERPPSPDSRGSPNARRHHPRDVLGTRASRPSARPRARRRGGVSGFGRGVSGLASRPSPRARRLERRPR